MQNSHLECLDLNLRSVDFVEDPTHTNDMIKIMHIIINELVYSIELAHKSTHSDPQWTNFEVKLNLNFNFKMVSKFKIYPNCWCAYWVINYRQIHCYVQMSRDMYMNRGKWLCKT